MTDNKYGLNDEFLKLAAPVEVLMKAAAKLKLKKKTHKFEWDEADAFIRQSDGSLFSWCEQFRCYSHMMYGIVNESDSTIIFKFDCKDVRWEPGKRLLLKLEKEDMVRCLYT